MNSVNRIRHHFNESIQTKINSADTLLETIADASDKIVQCLLDGHKILSCGNGGSASLALHFSSNMLNRFKHDRPSLPALSLAADIVSMTSISNTFSYDDIFAKQLRALGLPGDILLAISTSGNSVNILNTIDAAHDKQINIVALTGNDGGKIAKTLTEHDVEIRVPATDSARIQEIHLLIIHCICDAIDFQLFGHGETVV